jgi:Tfp pilus assembly protein PilN
MRALDLDFVQRARRLRSLGLALLLIITVATGYVGHIYYQQENELERWEAKQHSYQEMQSKNAESSAAQHSKLKSSQAELNAAAQAIDHLSFPWDRLFQEIESSVTEQVVLLSLEPIIGKKEVKIMAEAKNLSAMLDYVNTLQSRALFKDVHLESHQIQQQDPQKPVRFMVNAHWVDSHKM